MKTARPPKHIGIIGSRRRDTVDDFLAVLKAFRKIHKHSNDVIVSGGCQKGGDRFAKLISDLYHLEMITHLPVKKTLDEELMKKNPRAAYAKINYARNSLIAHDSQVLIACVASDRTGGTENTIKTWEKLNPEKKPILV